MGLEYIFLKKKNLAYGVRTLGWRSRPSARRKSTTQKHANVVEDEGSEYKASDHSETESADWELLTLEVVSKRKGKEPVVPKRKGKEKLAPTRGRKRAGGVEIREPTSDPPRRSLHQDEPVSPKQRAMFSSKLCIGEQEVGVRKLIEEAFEDLYENGNLEEICSFPEQSWYCLELIREFYMRADYLQDSEGGSVCV